MTREQQDATIDLGVASIETQGGDGLQVEIGGFEPAAGISDD